MAAVTGGDAVVDLVAVADFFRAGAAAAAS